jgi:hypothetical protein
MATRRYDFVTGIESDDAPTQENPSASGDIVSKGYADLTYSGRVYWADPVQDVAALKAISTTGTNPRGDKQVRLIEDNGELWYFDSAGTGTGDDVTVIEPTSGTGRWFIASGGGGGGGFSGVRSTKVAAYSVQAGDDGYLIPVDTSGQIVEITLPAPVAAFSVTIKDVGGYVNSNNILITRNASENIDGIAADDVIYEPYKAIKFGSDGTDWYRLSSFDGTVVGLNILLAGGFTGSVSDVIEAKSITTGANSSNVGSLSQARYDLAGLASSTRAIFGGGSTSSSTDDVNTIDYVGFIGGTAVDYGDLTASRFGLSSGSSSTRGLFVGGYDGATRVDTVDYVTIASVANATTFGTIVAASYWGSSCENATYVLSHQGFTTVAVTVLDYFTIASTGNSNGYGDISTTRYTTSSCSSSTRAIFGGGTGVSNVIDYGVLLSGSTLTDFGDLTVARSQLTSDSNKINGVFMGGTTGSATNTCDVITIASTGNATDHGDLTASKTYIGSASSSHGGI